MYSKDLERLVRTFVRQRVDREYIRHYLMETYQLDAKETDAVIAKVMGESSRTGRLKAVDGGVQQAVRRQRFY